MVRVRNDLDHFQQTRPAIGQAQRIAIVGCAGAGKSTLARELARITGLPHHTLDQLFFKPGWVPADEAAAEAEVRAIAGGPRWIIEGNYSATYPERFATADLVVWLDLATTTCLYRVIRRFFAYRGRVRPFAPEGCLERIDWPLIRYILGFRRRQRPKIEDAIARYVKAGTVVPIRNDFALRSFQEAMTLFVGPIDEEAAGTDPAAGMD